MMEGLCRLPTTRSKPRGGAELQKHRSGAGAERVPRSAAYRAPADSTTPQREACRDGSGVWPYPERRLNVAPIRPFHGEFRD